MQNAIHLLHPIVNARPILQFGHEIAGIVLSRAKVWIIRVIHGSIRVDFTVGHIPAGARRSGWDRCSERRCHERHVVRSSPLRRTRTRGWWVCVVVAISESMGIPPGVRDGAIPIPRVDRTGLHRVREWGLTWEWKWEWKWVAQWLVVDLFVDHIPDVIFVCRVRGVI